MIWAVDIPKHKHKNSDLNTFQLLKPTFESRLKIEMDLVFIILREVFFCNNNNDYFCCQDIHECIFAHKYNYTGFVS